MPAPATPDYHRPVRTLSFLLVTAVLLAGCNGRGAGPTDTPQPTSSAAPTLPSPNTAPPKVSPTLHIDKPPDDEVTTISGTLGFDSIEGGCAYLDAETKVRYEVLYPSGWKVDGSALRNADGEAVARIGDSITLRGKVENGMVSICQIGPIFRATEVVTNAR
jgi:hypothetical protein